VTLVITKFHASQNGKRSIATKSCSCENLFLFDVKNVMLSVVYIYSVVSFEIVNSILILLK